MLVTELQKQRDLYNIHSPYEQYSDVQQLPEAKAVNRSTYIGLRLHLVFRLKNVFALHIKSERVAYYAEVGVCEFEDGMTCDTGKNLTV
jgi:hypothetical protein